MQQSATSFHSLNSLKVLNNVHRYTMDCDKQFLLFKTNSSGTPGDSPHNRRSANYKPNIWKYDFLQSLRNKHNGEADSRQVATLVEDVRRTLVAASSLKAELELIDSIKKMGLGSLFEKEIEETLVRVASMDLKKEKDEDGEVKSKIEDEDPYTIALCFRLLRQHGHEVSEDVFKSFEDESGGFIRAKFGKIREVIKLMEASYLGREDETTLEKARVFSTEWLRKICSTAVTKGGNCTPEEEVNGDHQAAARHALELPLHWRVEWFDARWQIQAYEKDSIGGDVNSSLVELAKRNFNAVQAAHQNDLKELSRWWRELRLVEHLNFTRDRLVECFLCAVGLSHEPQHSSFRKSLTKVIIFILVIDDVYDLYGSLKELQCFTTAVDRWDINEMQQLPECMKLCFRALNEITDEIAYEIGAEEGWIQVLPHLRKLWVDFCKSLLVEAKWDSVGYTPSLEEYMENACITSSGPMILSHAAYFLANGSLDMAEDLLESHKDLIYQSSLIIRLCNDLGTSEAEKDRGDAPSSILCYMREKNVTEGEALKHIKELIAEAWKNINGRSMAAKHSSTVRSLIGFSSNATRVAHMLYQYGDGFGIQDGDIRRQILSSLIEPFA